ncbi:PDZ domain-containing protein [Candidatus Saccharibacteria bacterium]|nr:PDZ domain-containing protein [Candidatus Saccharibacteria bacterium]NCU40246.1 PDZ domain-containing protein [Candidatus Saccharibacteria bacterium]
MDILGVLNFALSVVIGLIILVVLVAVHELGHGIVARRNGVVVEEFGIGFPPFAWGKKIKNSILGKNVLFSLNWLPLGGFVKLQGENDSATSKGDYGSVSFWSKTKILLAGVLMNWLIAAGLFSIMAFTSGLPKLIPNQFIVQNDVVINAIPVKLAEVGPNLPAQKAGLKQGDQVVKIAGLDVLSPSDVSQISLDNAGKIVEIEFIRDGQSNITPVAIRSDNSDKKGYLGVMMFQEKPTTYRSSWSAPIVGVVMTGQLTTFTLSSLGDTFANFVTGLVNSISLNSQTREKGNVEIGKVGDSVGGPIALLGILFPSAREAGISSLILTTALVSLTLAVINILPIPGLDGGRWFVTLIYRKILNKPLSKDQEEKINGTGMLILFGLIILVTISDVTKLV